MQAGDLATQIACLCVMIRNLKREIEDTNRRHELFDLSRLGRKGPHVYRAVMQEIAEVRGELSDATQDLDHLLDRFEGEDDGSRLEKSRANDGA